MGAVEDAITAGYAVEIDLRLAADGTLVVFHDATLDRLTGASGPLIAQTGDELRRTAIKGCDETISSLTDVLALAAGRAALFLELKAPPAHAAQAAMVASLVKALSCYGGAVAAMTFDPDLLSLLRRALPDTPLGALAGGEGRERSLVHRFGRDMLLHTPRTRPDFIAYYGLALPHPAASLARRRRPLLAWTVRSAAEARRLASLADQIIFEGFRP